ncbi:MAG: hypothetical protein IJE19_03155 [Clostridia bacterium]|nr:hypothetical protein [Clostridia bacterium]
MAYIDKEFYDETFKGKEIPEDEFDRLADIASDVVFEICIIKPLPIDLMDEAFKKAVCYQTEMLFEQGGVDSIVGFSEAAIASGSESLGDYSVSSNSNSQSLQSYNGIPISSMTLMQLKRLGKMPRWAFADYYARRCNNGK